MRFYGLSMGSPSSRGHHTGRPSGSSSVCTWSTIRSMKTDVDTAARAAIASSCDLLSRSMA